MLKLWEIYVPTHWIENGQLVEIPTIKHYEWDNFVSKKAGGLSLHDDIKGKWLCSLQILHLESVVPVRIACSTEDMKEIAEFSKVFYKQEQILFYLVSPEIYIV